MNDQTSLAGFELPPSKKPTDRLFFALVPDEANSARIEVLSQSLKAIHGFRGALIKPEHLHITLHHLGDYEGVPENIVDMARKAAMSLRSTQFEFSFHRAMSFRRSQSKEPFVLTGADKLEVLKSFQLALSTEMIRAGLKHCIDKKFVPHATLLYDETLVPAHAVEPINWAAKDFVLIHSLLGQTKHIHLGRWSLSA